MASKVETPYCACAKASERASLASAGIDGPTLEYHSEMPKRILIVLLISSLVGGLAWYFSGKKAAPSVLEDPNFYHTAQGAHYRINELRAVLIDAVARDELHVIHDNMYYLEGLLDAFWKKLGTEEQARLGGLKARMKKVSGELDGFAGRGYKKATVTSLEKMFELMDELDKTYGAVAGTPTLVK